MNILIQCKVKSANLITNSNVPAHNRDVMTRAFIMKEAAIKLGYTEVARRCDNFLRRLTKEDALRLRGRLSKEEHPLRGDLSEEQREKLLTLAEAFMAGLDG